MSFFSKLKERLFKSSSKLDQGLEEIVEEGDDDGGAADGDAPADAPAPRDEGAQAPEERPGTSPPAQAQRPATGFVGRMLGGGRAARTRTLDDDMLESLEDLDRSLRKLGSRLFVLHGSPRRVFAAMFSGKQVAQLAFEAEDWLRRSGAVGRLLTAEA